MKPYVAQPFIRAAREFAAGQLDDQFPIDVYQTGSGTSSNMNANEVISNRAIELKGGDRFDKKKPIHANDHVNMGQSTNDMFPTAIHVAVGQAIQGELLPALKRLHEVLAEKAKEWTTLSRSAVPTWLMPRRSGWDRNSAATPGRPSCPWKGRSAPWPPSWSCRREAPRSAPASTRIHASAPGWPTSSHARRGFLLSRPGTIS